jgi:hypothetical protein
MKVPPKGAKYILAWLGAHRVPRRDLRHPRSRAAARHVRGARHRPAVTRARLRRLRGAAGGRRGGDEAQGTGRAALVRRVARRRPLMAIGFPALLTASLKRNVDWAGIRYRMSRSGEVLAVERLRAE